MKIIYIADARIPTEKAHGYQICKMCEEFSNAGTEIELWIPERNNKITDSAFGYYNIKNNFKIKKLKSFDFSKYDKFLRSFGYYMQSLFFLIKLLFIKLNKDTTIYTRDTGVAWLFSIKNYKVVYEMHSYPETKKYLFCFFIRRVNKIVVISSGLKNVLLKNNILEKNILIAYDGVDLEKFNINISKAEARKKLNLPEDTKIFLYAGLFDEWKGYLTLLQATKFINKKEAQLVMIGGDKDQVKKLKKEYPNVVFLGYLPYKTLPINQKVADVLILPNSGKVAISKFYTSPLKLFSYMSSQRPIVASDLPSLREILNEDNAILVKPDDPKELAKKIKIILSDQELSDKISEQAFRDVMNYTWQKRTNNILSFIKK